MLELPRAALLALWGTAAVRGDVPIPRAVRAIQGGDEPHVVSGAPGATTLSALLAELAATGATGLRAVLPAPGDPAGLTGPVAFTGAATDAGEAVLVEGLGPCVGLVPEVVPFGSDLEPGVLVTWHVHEVETPVAPSEHLPDADRAMREALRAATEMLARLDVSRWREDAAGRIAELTSGGIGADALPPGTGARAARVLAIAARVRAIASLALEDDGGAVTGWEAGERSRALRNLDGAARHALAIAASPAHPREECGTER